MSQVNIVHGTNPINLVEKIVRNKIFNALYYKEQCFGVTAATAVDRAIELDSIGGTFGGARRPCNFLCLVFKLLQINVEKEIIFEYIHNEHYKYVTALGAFYLRLTGTAEEIYEHLEPFYKDYRKLRRRLPDGTLTIIHMDEFMEELLTKDYSCDITLPFLPKRRTLEAIGKLKPRVSDLEVQGDLDAIKELDREKQESEKEKKETNGFRLKFKSKKTKPTKDEEEEEEKKTIGKRKRTEDDDPYPQERKEEMSIEETNKLRISLGLKPLDT